MANVKITELASGTALSGTELFEMVQGSFSKKTTAAEIGNAANNVRTVATGGTGQSTYIDGQLLIGNSTGNTLTKATLTGGSNITITNGPGTITINSTGGSGGVTSFSAGTTGFTPSSAIAGAVTLAGTLSIGNGGTNAITASGARSNLLPLYSGNAGKVLAVNSGSTDTEWISVGGTGTVTLVSALTIGTSGTNISSTVADPTTVPVITLNIPTASASNRGALSSTDWSTFNNKQALLSSGVNIKTVGGLSLVGSGDAGTIGVAFGGTGLSTLTSNAILIGNGTSNVSFVSPGANGNVLTSNGTTWSSQPSASGTMVYPSTNGITVYSGAATWATSLAIPTGDLVGTSQTGQILTNKRITPRANAPTTTTSPWAWSSNDYDIQAFSALANDLTINADSGTPTDGQKAIFRFKDNGIARNLSWINTGAKSMKAIGVTLPTVTVVNKTVYVGCIYNGDTGFWNAVAVSQEA